TCTASTLTSPVGTRPGKSVSRRCTAMTYRRPNACWRRLGIPRALRPRPGCFRLLGRQNSFPSWNRCRSSCPRLASSWNWKRATGQPRSSPRCGTARPAATLPLSLPLTMLGVFIPLSAVLHYLESWLAHDLAYRLLAEMRVRIYDVLDRLAPAYLYRRRSGDLVSLVTADVETVELFFAHTIAPGFVAVMVPVTVLAVLGYYAWPLAVALLPVLLLGGLGPFLAGRQPEALAGAPRAQLRG